MADPRAQAGDGAGRPSVSVLIPVINATDYLQETIECFGWLVWQAYEVRPVMVQL